MKTKHLILSLLITLISCNSNNEIPDCSAVTCLALELRVELIDKTTGENYIDSNALELSDFMLSIGETIEDDYEILNLYKNDDDSSLLFLPFEETSSIIVENDIVIPISMTRSLPTTNACCDLGEIETAEVTDYESEYDVNTRTLTIKI